MTPVCMFEYMCFRLWRQLTYLNSQHSHCPMNTSLPIQVSPMMFITPAPWIPLFRWSFSFGSEDLSLILLLRRMLYFFKPWVVSETKTMIKPNMSFKYKKSDQENPVLMELDRFGIVGDITGTIGHSLFYLLQMAQFIWLGKIVWRKERIVPFMTAMLVINLWL